MKTSSVFGLHVRRAARLRYAFDPAGFYPEGSARVSEMRFARDFADRINRVRDAKQHPELSVHAADLHAAGLIQQTLYKLLDLYRQKTDPGVIDAAIGWFAERLGPEATASTLTAYVDCFPPLCVRTGELTAAAWLKQTTEGRANRERAMQSLILLWLANANPAFTPMKELIDDAPLATSAYPQIAAGLRGFFAHRPRFGKGQRNLIDLLRAPASSAPDSLSAQLAFLRDEFGEELPELYNTLLTALDLLKEQELALWALYHPVSEETRQKQQRFDGWTKGGSSMEDVPKFGYKGAEYERFSDDVEWMPTTVMIAKSTYVWLDQLSKQYQRPIAHLNEIPEQELATLAHRGFNALWLIGVWERSTASRRIKHMNGNPDAAASAYSLYDYSIAADLGGEDAYRALREMAARHGLRLASDMVPNHMGIDSRWVNEHPDWFLSLPYKPYPNYNFTGPDLSSDGRVEIRLEDHYADRSDAAVVFERRDRWSGETRYVYHGNDGTSFPWNDTAQLNYLNPDAREAVMQTILSVARKFPIIRFDAAMTLTKQHFQRLWYPAPGSGAGIPSRTEHGLSKPDFDRAMPNEFWREVVDRVAVEAPGTLLLAEAFWLLEGYFVRTLGMHRVYNSAFMNMMRDEENANYRSVIKNTLEFDPEILKRYVNFMNNPDERTAEDQFGKGDKYFGVCTLLATLPGLPMYGHGQVEGLSERYGMEYKRAYYDEQPDGWMIARHEREIAPLLHRRRLFCESDNFLLFDLYDNHGHVNEDVYAYTNRRDGERAVVVYNNRYSSASGWIHESAAYAEKTEHGKQMRRRSLAEGLDIQDAPGRFVACREIVTGEEHLFSAHDIAHKGLHFSLGAYQRRVLLDWRIVQDAPDAPWSQLFQELKGATSHNLDEALQAIRLRPLHKTFAAIFDDRQMKKLFAELKPTKKLKASESDIEAKLAADDMSSKLIAKVETAQEIAPLTAPASDVAPKLTAAQNAAETISPSIATANALDKTTSPAAAEKVVAERKALPPAAEALLTAAREFCERLRKLPGHDFAIEAALSAFAQKLAEAHCWLHLPETAAAVWDEQAAAVLPTSGGAAEARVSFVAWALLDAISEATKLHPLDLFDQLRLRHTLAAVYEKLGTEGEDRWRAAARLRFLLSHAAAEGKRASRDWVYDPEVGWLIGVHEYEGAHYIHRELYERLLWLTHLPELHKLAAGSLDAAQSEQELAAIARRKSLAAEGGYKLEALLDD